MQLDSYEASEAFIGAKELSQTLYSTKSVTRTVISPDVQTTVVLSKQICTLIRLGLNSVSARRTPKTHAATGPSIGQAPLASLAPRRFKSR